MTRTPQTRYAKSGDVEIAYQLVGDGPIDLVYVTQGQIPIEFLWDEPRLARNLDRLSSFSRLICLDVRGYGASERVSFNDLPAVQAWMDDILAVMDAVGSQRAALVATSHGGLYSMLLAASHPERTAALVLINCYARFLRDSQQPWALPADVLDRFIAVFQSAWGTGENIEGMAPSVASNPRTRAWWGRAERCADSPRTFAALSRLWLETDVRDILPGIRVPTLVIHRRDLQIFRVQHGRYLAEKIPDAKYAELPGVDAEPFLGEADDLLDEVEEFLTGVRRGPDIDRVLATVMFTDIVGSTERASTLGDRGWKGLLDVHDALVRQELERHRGREVKTTGDGVLATFDGPARAISCATAIGEAVRTLGLEVRSGLHTGEVELRGEDIGGVAVHIAARINDMAGPGEVLVSRTVKDLVVGSGIRFADRGVHALKGMPDEWQLFIVES